MNIHKRIIAATELLLISPAALFLTAVLVRTLRPLRSGPEHTAQQIVMWYSGRGWTLWVLLIGLPLAALLTGGVTLLWNWNRATGARPAAWQLSAASRLHLATPIIAGATLAAGMILAVVALHILAN